MNEPILSHEQITADDGRPRSWIYVLHGIYGAGRNWASVMRRVVRERTDWGALLVDLRQHGDSLDFPPPHTLDNAAADIDRLAQHTGLQPAAMLGHSFGGKVALVFTRSTPAPPQQVWLIDSTPQAREPDGSAWDMLGILESLPRQFETRKQLVEELRNRGQSEPVAQWMATNLVADDGGYRWRFDFDSIRDLLLSFYDTDAWDVVESPPPGTEIHLVKAEASRLLSGETLARAVRVAESSDRTFLHRVEGGHWLNADNPAAIESLLVQMLPSG